MSANPEPMSAPDEFVRRAATYVTRNVPTAKPDDDAGSTWSGLAGTDFESVHDIAVLRGTTLAGIVSIERLLAAPSDTKLGDLMDPDPAVVTGGTHQEQVAAKLVDHGESSVAVVDEHGAFAGLVPPRRMLKVLLAEHDEDLARIGGYLAGTNVARLAAEESVAQRLVHRMPWLLIGLAGAMVSAVMVGAFEAQLDKKVLVAFFVPAIVYMSGAVATQTATLLIRGLSVGIDFRRVLWRELATGLFAGLLIGGVFMGFATVVWGDVAVAATVALALVAGCSTATIVAMALPYAFQHFGIDPAFGSGPLVTVIQDLLSIAVYLALATLIVF
jgi:magnesium transporter